MKFLITYYDVRLLSVTKEAVWALDRRNQHHLFVFFCHFDSSTAKVFSTIFYQAVSMKNEYMKIAIYRANKASRLKLPYATLSY